jgi:hypothetical protein
MNEVDEWNEAAVKERKGWTMRQLVDELVAGWFEIQGVIARLRPEHLDAPMTLGPDITIPAGEFLTRMAAHTSRHAGQLVPASRARHP